MNSSGELQITFKTVSEFRKNRTSLKPACTQAQNPALPSLDIDTRAAKSVESTQIPDLPREKNHEYFDLDCQVTEVPSSFVCTESSAESSPVLAEFMNNAVDFESAFDYVDSLSCPNNKPMFVSLPVEFKNELEADDGNGVCVPMQTADFLETQEMPLPDEPSLATCRVIDQAAVIKDPQDLSSITEVVERDQSGRVIRALYYGGESVQFRYAENGLLIEFTYAGLQWKPVENGWTANDRQTEYFVDAAITVLDNGSIRIERDDVVRILKLSGTRIDEHKSGSRTESRKLKNKPSPYDLLAKAKAVNSVWLTGAKSMKTSGEHPTSSNSPMVLDMMTGGDAAPNASVAHASSEQEISQTMIPNHARAPQLNGALMNSSNLTCVPSVPIELRSLERTDKLRSLEDELQDPESEGLLGNKLQLQMKECWLKSCLWLTDRFVGQSSPRHLEQLEDLAALYFLQQKNDLAELTYLRALHIKEQYFGKGQAELASCLNGLAAIYEQRGNFVRAEEMYKESISLQENGLRKQLFLFSENVIGGEKLSPHFNSLFLSVAGLSRLYALQGKQKLCVVVYEKALSLMSEIIQKEPSCQKILQESAAGHLDELKQLSA